MLAGYLKIDSQPESFNHRILYLEVLLILTAQAERERLPRGWLNPFEALGRRGPFAPRIIDYFQSRQRQLALYKGSGYPLLHYVAQHLIGSRMGQPCIFVKELRLKDASRNWSDLL